MSCEVLWRSIANKTMLIQYFAVDNLVDILMITIGSVKSHSGSLLSDNRSKANESNSYFTNIGSTLANYDDPYDFKERQEQYKLNSTLVSAVWIASTAGNYIACEPALSLSSIAT